MPKISKQIYKSRTIYYSTRILYLMKDSSEKFLMGSSTKFEIYLKV